jgi:hypothetical protein
MIADVLLGALHRAGFLVIQEVGSRAEPTGRAWMENDVRYIVIQGDRENPIWCFVLLHEYAHHVLGHTARWTTQPAWIIEYAADQLALQHVLLLAPEAYEVCEQASRDHIRPLLQTMIDAEIWHHVDETISDWAGCVLPAEARAVLAGVLS